MESKPSLNDILKPIFIENGYFNPASTSAPSGFATILSRIWTKDGSISGNGGWVYLVGNIEGLLQRQRFLPDGSQSPKESLSPADPQFFEKLALWLEE